MVTKLSRVLEEIKEVMMLEQADSKQADSEHLHLLHLANIKLYVQKKSEVISSD